jgi:hypothetical protein
MKESLMLNRTYDDQQTLAFPQWWPVRISKRQPNAYSKELEQTQLAFHRAYRRFAGTHATWVRRGFDADFLRRTLVSRLTRRQQAGAMADHLPAGMTLALAWDRQFGPLASDTVRTQQLAELTTTATHFLHLFEQALRQLAAEPVEK